MDLRNVRVIQGGETLISGANGRTGDGFVEVYSDNPGLNVGDAVTIKGEPDFDSPASYIDEEPSGTLNFKIG